MKESMPTDPRASKARHTYLSVVTLVIIIMAVIGIISEVYPTFLKDLLADLSRIIRG